MRSELKTYNTISTCGIYTEQYLGWSDRAILLGNLVPGASY